MLWKKNNRKVEKPVGKWLRFASKSGYFVQQLTDTPAGEEPDYIILNDMLEDIAPHELVQALTPEQLLEFSGPNFQKILFEEAQTRKGLVGMYPDVFNTIKEHHKLWEDALEQMKAGASTPLPVQSAPGSTPFAAAQSAPAVALFGDGSNDNSLTPQVLRTATIHPRTNSRRSTPATQRGIPTVDLSGDSVSTDREQESPDHKKSRGTDTDTEPRYKVNYCLAGLHASKQFVFSDSVQKSYEKDLKLYRTEAKTAYNINGIPPNMKLEMAMQTLDPTKNKRHSGARAVAFEIIKEIVDLHVAKYRGFTTKEATIIYNFIEKVRNCQSSRCQVQRLH